MQCHTRQVINFLCHANVIQGCVIPNIFQELSYCKFISNKLLMGLELMEVCPINHGHSQNQGGWAAILRHCLTLYMLRGWVPRHHMRGREHQQGKGPCPPLCSETGTTYRRHLKACDNISPMPFPQNPPNWLEWRPVLNPYGQVTINLVHLNLPD